MEVSAFMTEQLKEQLQLQRDHDEKVWKQMEAKLQAQQEEAEAQRKEAAAKLEQQRQGAETTLEAQKQEVEAQKKENETLRAELAARPRLAKEVVGEEELAALQSRLQSLHDAKLLTDEEAYGLEDAIVDCIEVMPTAGASAPEVEKVAKMVLVSAKVPGDAALARQLRRKFV